MIFVMTLAIIIQEKPEMREDTMEVTLRKWQIGDGPSIARYGNNPKIAANLRDGFPYPYTLADGRAFVERCIGGDETLQCCRAIVVDGEAVGSIGVFLQTDVYRKCGELGYWLGEPFWGQGIMTRAVEEICDHVFANYDVARIYAEPFAENVGSRRVLEKAGFALEGTMRWGAVKNGRLMDWCMYAKLKGKG